MKVGTDSTLLGAWALAEKAQNVLDIGCGTGILSLMLAQRSQAQFTAIEIDKIAAEQAAYNVAHSPFAGRIEVLPLSLQAFAAKKHSTYDCIISNPPYFEKNTASDQRSMARSQNTLSLEELVLYTAQMLSPEGDFFIVLPSSQQAYFLELCQSQDIYLQHICFVKGNPEAMPKRILLHLSRTKIDWTSEELIIEEKGRHQYSARYKELLGSYLSIFSGQ